MQLKITGENFASEQKEVFVAFLAVRVYGKQGTFLDCIDGKKRLVSLLLPYAVDICVSIRVLGYPFMRVHGQCVGDMICMIDVGQLPKGG